MSKLVEDAKKVLAALPPRPWKIEYIPHDIPSEEAGALRVAANNGNIFQPFPESTSFVLAPVGVLGALAKLGSIADALVAELDKDTPSRNPSSSTETPK